jgi:glycosyltransferase involved in cell wall biosynthesis
MKTLVLIASGLNRPEERQLIQLEEADQAPRVSLFGRTLNADFLDERYLEHAGRPRSQLYKRLPIVAAQVLEAYRVRHRYDAVISWAESLGIPLAGLMKVRRTRIPHLAIFSWISKPKKAHLLKRVYSHIDRIVLMSSVQRDFAVNTLGINPSRILFTRWSVDQKFWRMSDERGDMICAVGSEMRDYPTLVAALAGSTIRCHIAAGTGRMIDTPWTKAVEQRETLPENITVGKKRPMELRELYARSRFVVIPLLPTDTDNGTTSILEAMAMGKAVICSRVRGQQDVIRDGENGLFAPPQDPRALREAIEYLWNNPDVADRMGRAGRALVEQHHTLDQFVHLIRSAVEEVVMNYREGRLAHDQAASVSSTMQGPNGRSSG